MKRKETDILNRFYKDCGMELFKLRTEHKLNLIKLSHKTLIPAAKLDLIERGECREPKLVAFYGKLIHIKLTE